MATIQYVRYPTTAASANSSVGPNGAAIPTSATLIGGEDPSLDLQPLQLDASNNLKVNIAAGTLTVINPSVSATGSAVPSDATFAGMNVAGNLTGLTGTANGLKVDGSAVTQPVSAASLPLPSGASTSALQTQISGQIPATLGAHVTSASLAVNIASDQTVPVSISGNQAINLVQVAGASVAQGHGLAATAIRVELPTDGTGAVGLNAGSNIVGKVGLDQTTPGTTNAVSLSQIGSTTIASGNGVVGTGVQRVAIASDNTPFGVNSIAKTPSAGTVTQAAITIGTTAIRLTVSGSAPSATRSVLSFTPDSASTAKFYIGSSSVTNSGATRGIQIVAGQSFIANSDAGDYFVISDTAAQTGYVMEQA